MYYDVFVRFLNLELWYHIMTGMRRSAGHFLLPSIRQKGPVDLFSVYLPLT